MPILTNEDRIGTLLAEKYRLESVLGRGGMATVFDGRHEWTGRRVAVKVLNHELATDPMMSERFLREARTSAGLKHPNVVDVLDMGRAEDGAVYLVLERLYGQDLADALGGDTFEPAAAFAILGPVMRALAYAHAKGVVHRDLKPENIFVHHDHEGRPVPKVLDFGIAKSLDSASTSMTASGTILGTPEYMSPEQARALADIGPSSDVWSIGVVWYACLAGRLPFEDESPPALVIAIATTRAPSIAAVAPSLHPALAAAIDRALEPDRSIRYADMQTFLDAMIAAADAAGVPVEASVREVPSRPAPSGRVRTAESGSPESKPAPAVTLEDTRASVRPPSPSATRSMLSWAGSRAQTPASPQPRNRSIGVLGAVLFVASLTAGGLALHDRHATNPSPVPVPTVPRSSSATPAEPARPAQPVLVATPNAPPAATRDAGTERPREHDTQSAPRAAHEPSRETPPDAAPTLTPADASASSAAEGPSRPARDTRRPRGGTSTSTAPLTEYE